VISKDLKSVYLGKGIRDWLTPASCRESENSGEKTRFYPIEKDGSWRTGGKNGGFPPCRVEGGAISAAHLLGG